MSRYYSNETENESEGYWVYYNGELYHAGVKGMHWYQHLPWTDWWKVGKNAYNRYMQKNTTTTQKPGYQYVDGKMVPYEPQTKKASKIKALGSAVRAVSTYAGNQFKNTKVGRGIRNFKERAELKAIKYFNKAKGFTSEQVAKLSEFARNAYASARTSVQNYFTASLSSQFKTDLSGKTTMSHLDEYQSKQMRDCVKVYQDGKVNGSFGNTLNQWFQNAQYGIVKGVNNYLKQIGLDDEVDTFISKVTGKSSKYQAQLHRTNTQQTSNDPRKKRYSSW